MSVLPREYLCSFGGEPNINMLWLFVCLRLDVSLALVILRFTSVDVSVATGIPMFIWEKPNLDILWSFVGLQP